MAIRDIASAINQACEGTPLENFQDLRKTLHHKKRQACVGIFKINDTNSINDKNQWAFNYGGRREIQYNISIERIKKEKCLRYGLAFSLEPSRSLHDPVLTLSPKIERFNTWLEKNPDEFSDLLIYDYFEEAKSPIEQRLRPIPKELIKRGHFFFFGTLRPIDAVSIRDVATLFNRLLPLYIYVESEENLSGELAREGNIDKSLARLLKKPESTVVNAMAGQREISLRHNKLQKKLVELLKARHPKDYIAYEIHSVDVLRKNNKESVYYEIKTDEQIRYCIRRAVGQLLEYSRWPGNKPADKLIIVSECKLTESANKYLKTLRSDYVLPIYYQQLVIGTDGEAALSELQ